jgi:hypothetical protein
MLDPVNKVVAEDEGANYLQKTFVSALKMDPAIVKVHYKPRSVWYSLPGKVWQSKVTLSH